MNEFDYTVIDNQAKKTLFLFHGTGGDKTNLLFFDQLLQKSYNLVGLQGNVREHGMPRFFKRTATGVFDQESIVVETDKLAKFVGEWPRTEAGFLGYSNGANMILATILRFPKLVKTAVTLHPMLPFSVSETPDLSDLKVFVSIGIHDSVIPAELGEKAAQTLADFKARVTLKTYQSGHEVTDQEIDDIVHFLR